MISDERSLSNRDYGRELERMEEIKHAVLERSGHITIIPRAKRA